MVLNEWSQLKHIMSRGISTIIQRYYSQAVPLQAIPEDPILRVQSDDLHALWMTDEDISEELLGPEI
jgi:hypothetical protein